MIIVLNGPLGIGKSTLAEALVERIDDCVLLDGDHLVAADPPAADETAHLHSTIALLVARGARKRLAGRSNDMTSRLEHTAPASAGRSFRQQMTLVFLSWRWLYPLVAAFALMLLATVTNPSFSLFAGILCIIVAALWPTILWYKEAPSQRAYHWSLPVARPVHDLMRVVVGLLYLLAICTVIGAAGAIGDGSLRYFMGGGLPSLAGFYLVPVATYLLMSPIALWSDYRVTRRILTGMVLFGFVGVIAEGMGFPWFVRALSFLLADGRWSFAETMTAGIDTMYRARAGQGAMPPSADWIIGPAIWIALGTLFTLLAARFRPDDIKRRLTRRARTTAASMEQAAALS